MVLALFQQRLYNRCQNSHEVDISSMESIDSEWDSHIPTRLLQKNYLVHVENVIFYRGIDVRPGMPNMFYRFLRFEFKST